MKKLNIMLAMLMVFSVATFAQQSMAEEKKEALPQVLIKNVNIFDGSSDTLATGQDVLVEGKLIKKNRQGFKGR